MKEYVFYIKRTAFTRTIAFKDTLKAYFQKQPLGLRLATLLEERLWHRCFPVYFAKFPRTPFFTEHLWTAASVFLAT